MRRLLLAAALAALLVAPLARAWTWPSDGAVLQGFSFDPAHPYAAGQHRGIDIAGAAGASVVAPTGGTVSFAGSVPSSGKTVSIETGDGYTVTLTHLGSTSVSKGASVNEGDAVGTIGSGGYVQLGVRTTSNDQGYLDPMSFLPARVAAPPSLVPAPAPDPTTDTAAEPAEPAPAADAPAADPSTPAADEPPPVADAPPADAPPADAPPADAPPVADTTPVADAPAADPATAPTAAPADDPPSVAAPVADPPPAAEPAPAPAPEPAPVPDPAPAAATPGPALPAPPQELPAAPLAVAEAPPAPVAPALPEPAPPVAVPVAVAAPPAAVTVLAGAAAVAPAHPAATPVAAAPVVPHAVAPSVETPDALHRPRTRLRAHRLPVTRTRVRPRPRPVPHRLHDLPIAGRAVRATRPHPQARHRSLLPFVLLAAAAPLLLAARALRKPVPTMDGHALLRDHADLLRQRPPAHRSRLYDDRGGHPRAPSPAAWRGDVLPHRRGRACDQGLARR